MKRTFQLTALPILLVVAISCLATSCEEPANPDGNGDGLKLPKVTITAGEAGENQISFTLSPENASEVRYLVMETSELLPDASGVMSDGEEADPTVEKEYTVDGLVPSTAYTVLAAAKNADGLTSLVAKLEMTTADHEPVFPTVAVSDVAVNDNVVTFNYVLTDAEKAFWVCLPASETAPDAQGIFSAGTEFTEDEGSVTVSDLSYETDYVIYAAAQNADGYSEVESAAFSTLEAPVPVPAVGDFYYSDGTWSTSSSDPDPSKTVIGIIFKTGEASDDLSDYSNAGLDEVRGFVVSIENAMQVESAWWGDKEVSDFEWTLTSSTDAGTSQSEDDFSGYYNTLKIKEYAASTYAEGLTYKNLKAAYAAVNHTPEAPEGTTGWFFPSAGQMKEMFSVYSTISSSLEKIQGESLIADYWTSTTQAESNPVFAYCVHFDGSSATLEACNQMTRVWKVRPMLAF